MRNPEPHLPRLALGIALLAPSLRAFDPLLDDAEPFATWTLSKDASYTASSAPTWEMETRLAASKDVALEASSWTLEGSLGFLADDFQLDTAWNLEPRLAASWSKGRLSLEGDGWGLWNDLGWTDEGGGAGATWLVNEPAADQATWKTGVHGWTSEHAGSAIGASVWRHSVGGAWSNGFSTTVRRLWEVDATRAFPGSLRRSASSSAVSDQWQALVQGNVDRNWRTWSAGLGLDLDLRAVDAETSAAASAMGRGKRTSANASFPYTATLDPSASVSWKSADWGLAATLGSSVDVQRGNGSITPATTFWTSVSATRSW